MAKAAKDLMISNPFVVKEVNVVLFEELAMKEHF